MLIKRNDAGQWLSDHGAEVRLALGGKEWSIAFGWPIGEPLHIVTAGGEQFSIYADVKGVITKVVQTNYGAIPGVCGVHTEVTELTVDENATYAELMRLRFSAEGWSAVQYLSEYHIRKLQGHDYTGAKPEWFKQC